MFKKIDNALAYRVFTGGPLINIYTKSEGGKFDGMTAAWSCPYDPDLLLIVLDKNHTTVENLLATKKLVIALPNEQASKDALVLGGSHGRDNPNKLDGLDLIESENFKYPLLKNSLAYFECSLEEEYLLTSKGICLARVNNVYVSEENWDAEAEAFVPGCTKTLRHVSGATFVSGGKLIG